MFPAVKPAKFAVAVDPVMVPPPGLTVTVHGVTGKPLNATVAVATAQVGCVIAPTTGAGGVPRFNIALPDATEVQPEEVNVTVNVYVLGDKPAKFAVAAEPVIVAPPGLAVTVHGATGKPLKATVPVATAQVGCVIAPTTGADGVTGCALTTALPDAAEVHPSELVTVKLYVPVAKPEIVALAVLPATDPGLTVQFPAGRPLNTTLPVATAQVG